MTPPTDPQPEASEFVWSTAERLVTDELVASLAESSQQNTDLDMCGAKHSIMARNIAEDVIVDLLNAGWVAPDGTRVVIAPDAPSAPPATVDDTALRERIKDVFERESLTPDTAYVEADRGVLLYELMAVVQPVLSAKEAEVERLRAELERERDPNVELSLANQAAFSAGLAAEQARYADGFKLERDAARAELAALRAQQVAMVRLPEDWRAQLREDLKVPRYVQAAEWCIEAWRSATEIAVGDRVEWNPEGDRWEPAVVTGVNRHHLVIVLDDNGQSSTVERRHVRRAVTESHPAVCGDEDIEDGLRYVCQEPAGHAGKHPRLFVGRVRPATEPSEITQGESGE